MGEHGCQDGKRKEAGSGQRVTNKFYTDLSPWAPQARERNESNPANVGKQRKKKTKKGAGMGRKRTVQTTLPRRNHANWERTKSKAARAYQYIGRVSLRTRRTMYVMRIK